MSSRVIDVVQEGLSQSRSTMIICRRSDEVRAAILDQMERGWTVLHGEGGYTGEARDVLVCAVPQTEVSRLKRLVQEIDPDAFVIVAPASEVLGEGFRGLAAP